MKGEGRATLVGNEVWRSFAGPKTICCSSVAVGLAGDRFGDQADDDVVGVRVLVVRAGGELERVGADPADDLLRRDVAAGVGFDLFGEALGLGVVGHAAGVVEHLPHGHRAPGRRHPGEPLADRVVEAELAGLDEVQRDGAAEGLGDAGDPHVVGRPRRLRLR